MDHTEKLAMSDPGELIRLLRKEVLDEVEMVQTTYADLVSACTDVSKATMGIASPEDIIKLATPNWRVGKSVTVPSDSLPNWIESQWSKIDKVLLQRHHQKEKNAERAALIRKLGLTDSDLKLLGVRTEKKKKKPAPSTFKRRDHTWNIIAPGDPPPSIVMSFVFWGIDQTNGISKFDNEHPYRHDCRKQRGIPLIGWSTDRPKEFS